MECELPRCFQQPEVGSDWLQVSLPWAELSRVDTFIEDARCSVLLIQLGWIRLLQGGQDFCRLQ